MLDYNDNVPNFPSWLWQRKNWIDSFCTYQKDANYLQDLNYNTWNLGASSPNKNETIKGKRGKKKKKNGNFPTTIIPVLETVNTSKCSAKLKGFAADAVLS